MRHKNYDFSQACPVEAALEVIGGKWKGIILYHLLDGEVRFSELKRKVGSVTQRMLTKQLRELENDGLIARKVYAVVPPKVEYSLTEKGHTLDPILIALRDWAASMSKRAKTNTSPSTMRFAKQVMDASLRLW